MTDELRARPRAVKQSGHDAAASPTLARIVDEATERWPLQAATVIHRVGPMKPADDIVLVLTASAHRHAAYQANEFIMDYLKTEAPFWKREFTAQGAEWVDARESDEAARQRWQS